MGKSEASITIRMPQEKRESLNKAAETTGISSGSIVRNLIYKYLEDQNVKPE